MSPTQFLSQLNNVPDGGGDGIKIEHPVSLRDFYLASSGADLTTTLTTNPGFTKGETNGTILRWNTSIVVAAGVNIELPRDYDPSADHLKVRFLALNSDGAALTVAAYRKRAGEALTANLAPDASDALTGDAAFVEVDLSGNGLQGGDALTLTVTPGAHAAAAVDVYAVFIEYKSMIVFADASVR